jgi:hypothetical protein
VKDAGAYGKEQNKASASLNIMKENEEQGQNDMMKIFYVVILILGLAIVAPAGRPEIDTNMILKNSARYCERLKTATFHFICMESVKEIIRDQKGKRKKNTFLYDYQIIGKEGKADETRTLMQINGVSMPPQKNARLEIGFYSHLSVYAPILLLAWENQGKFRYRIIKEERIKGVKTWVIDVEPLDERGIFIHGRVWLAQNDFSVLCIEVNPGALGGLQKKQENALKLGARLWITDTHWYEVRHDGLRFPSRTEFHEEYRFDKNRPLEKIHSTAGGRGSAALGPEGYLGSPERSSGGAVSTPGLSGWTWNRSETSFTYSRYQFFQVQMDVKEHPLEE